MLLKLRNNFEYVKRSWEVTILIFKGYFNAFDTIDCDILLLKIQGGIQKTVKLLRRNFLKKY